MIRNRLKSIGETAANQKMARSNDFGPSNAPLQKAMDHVTKPNGCMNHREGKVEDRDRSQSPDHLQAAMPSRELFQIHSKVDCADSNNFALFSGLGHGVSSNDQNYSGVLEQQLLSAKHRQFNTFDSRQHRCITKADNYTIHEFACDAFSICERMDVPNSGGLLTTHEQVRQDG